MHLAKSLGKGQRKKKLNPACLKPLLLTLIRKKKNSEFYLVRPTLVFDPGLSHGLELVIKLGCLDAFMPNLFTWVLVMKLRCFTTGLYNILNSLILPLRYRFQGWAWGCGLGIDCLY